MHYWLAVVFVFAITFATHYLKNENNSWRFYSILNVDYFDFFCDVFFFLFAIAREITFNFVVRVLCQISKLSIHTRSMYTLPRKKMKWNKIKSRKKYETRKYLAIHHNSSLDRFVRPVSRGSWLLGSLWRSVRSSVCPSVHPFIHPFVY